MQNAGTIGKVPWFRRIGGSALSRAFSSEVDAGSREENA
jgi:hypothetical protein